MRRTFIDSELLEWEAYVTGGQPHTPTAARIFFLCLTAPARRPLYTEHSSRDVAVAERELESMSDEELHSLLATATPLE